MRIAPPYAPSPVAEDSITTSVAKDSITTSGGKSFAVSRLSFAAQSTGNSCFSFD
jgi:hypothetical protein